MKQSTRIAVLFPNLAGAAQIPQRIVDDLTWLAGELHAQVELIEVRDPAGVHAPDCLDQRPDLLQQALLGAGSADNLAALGRLAQSVDADVVAWTCTSGSFLGEPSVLGRQVETLRSASGLPATTTSVAVLEALRKLYIERVCVVTPYPEEIGSIFAQFIERHGFRVVGHAHLGGMNEERLSELTAADFESLARSVWSDAAQAWVIPCTALCVGGIKGWFESQFGVPVVMANSSTIEHAVAIARKQ